VNYRSFLNRDYKSLEPTRRGAGRHWPLRLLVLAAGLTVLGVVLAKTQQSSPEVATASHLPVDPVRIKAGDDNQIPTPTSSRVTIELTLPDPGMAPTRDWSVTDSGDQWREVVVARGDSLSSIFSDLEIHSQLEPILGLGDPVQMLRSIYPGERFRALKLDGALSELIYEPDGQQHLHIRRTQEGYAAERIEHETEIRLHHAWGTIDDSLFAAGVEAGLSENLIMELAAIFGWDIDFALDIRKGDEFTLVYEERYRDGDKLEDGRILAAQFTNQGRSYTAILYTDPDGRSAYYSPNGRSMRKTFLRAPVDFRRISSRFQRERWHPVLGVKRPHRGVDYAAAIGTPIKAAGDGKVIHRGTKGGYGKTVIIQHGERYSTLYAHMSRYSKRSRVGTRVKQGQIIGYVGKTGLATGPHLHYEFRVNGVHRNPLTVKLPSAKPLPKKHMADFETVAAPLLAQLDLYKRTALARQ
jgi:murein DD-endopeptidase MepM/ murein hydrolase activator NlpD